MVKKVKSNPTKLLLKNWKETRKLTLDWISAVSAKNLNKKLPRLGLDTFAKQIWEMADVQDAYLKTLNGTAIDFSKVTDGTNLKQTITKKKLKNRLVSSDNSFKRISATVDDWDESINIFGKKSPKYSVLELMTRHETLHHGQFISYGYLLGIRFPKSWIKTWAIPTKK